MKISSHSKIVNEFKFVASLAMILNSKNSEVNIMKNEEQNKIDSYLTFKLGEEEYATHVSNVLNILEMTSITKVPKSPEYMKGVINLRGIGFTCY